MQTNTYYKNVTPLSSSGCRWPQGALWSRSAQLDQRPSPGQKAPGSAQRSSGVSGSRPLGLLRSPGQRQNAAAAAGKTRRRVRCTFILFSFSGADFGARVQPGHRSCHQEGRRAGESVRVLPRHAPATQPG